MKFLSTYNNFHSRKRTKDAVWKMTAILSEPQCVDKHITQGATLLIWIGRVLLSDEYRPVVVNIGPISTQIWHIMSYLIYVCCWKLCFGILREDPVNIIATDDMASSVTGVPVTAIFTEQVNMVIVCPDFNNLHNLDDEKLEQIYWTEWENRSWTPSLCKW